jgi:plasmid stabilization system protein ParE
MGKYKINYSTRAKTDLLKIRIYIINQGRKSSVASDYVEKIKKAADSLSSAPHKYRVVDEKRGLRRCNVKKTSHFILFTVDERRELVIVEYIFHNKQDWQSRLLDL